MPFTPFHFGPGALFKAFLRDYFSFSLFVFTQVFIDCEPYYFLLRNETPVHRLLHTFLGATLVVLAGVVVGKPIVEKIFKRKIGVAAAVISSALGAYSHVLFDSLMHLDMHPLRPFSEANPLLGSVSFPFIHGACLVAGAVGFAIWLIQNRYKTARRRRMRGMLQ